MQIFHRLFLVLCLVHLSSASYAQVVGLTEGQFRVDESGAATYTLPIATPTGRAGVTPSIALTYSSNNLAEGTVGVGWSVSGMSSISRCPPTPIHDSEIKAVQYNNQDKLCLDGRRLILLPNTGAYLAPNSEYRFEVDNFSTIVAKGGSTTNGPQYFEVTNKAGETHYYGNSAAISTMFSDHGDAFVEPGGTTVGVKAKMWMLKVVKDVKSNFILYNYTKNTTKGSLYLDNIEYSGNIALYKQPYAKIQLVYRTYDKGFKGYYAGAHTYHDKLLERIDTSIDDDIYRAYYLEYEESDFIEERTLLTSVQECPDNDGTMGNCRPPTTFDWQRPALGTSGTHQVCHTEPGEPTFCHNAPYTTNYSPFPSIQTVSSSAPNHYTTQVFDINGDGFQDIVYVNGSYWYAKLGPSFNSPTLLSSIGVNKKEYAMNIDYDGDGVRDLLVANSETSNWYVISYNQSNAPANYCPAGGTCNDYTYTSTVSVVNLGVTATGMEGEAQIMDVNGDGNEDIVFRHNADLKAHLNNGDGTFTGNYVLHTLAATPSASTLNDGHTAQTGDMKSASQIDINGDGRSDLIMKVTTTTGGCYINGQLLPFVRNSYECHYDMGGTWSTHTSTKNHIYVATGTIAAPSLTKHSEFGGGYENIRIADFNGDGLSDLAYVYNNKWYYRLSNGLILLESREMGLVTSSTLKDLTQFVDLNGDGRADVLHATSNSGWHVYFSHPTESEEWILFQNRGTKSFDYNAVVRFGDANGDGKLDMLTSTGGSWKRHYSRDNIKEYVISTITTGFGVPTTIAYLPMTNSTMYVMQGSDANSDSDTFSPMSGASLVAQVNTQSHNSSWVSVRYEYGGMLIHKKGRGNLGFQMLRTIDLQSDVISETQYSQEYSGTNFAKAGMPIYSEQSRNGYLLSRAVNSLAVEPTAQGGLFPYVASSTELSYVFNSNNTSNHLSTTVTTNTYDTWGNPLEIDITVTQAGTTDYTNTKTTNLWGNATEKRFGRLQQTQVVKNRTGDEDDTTRISTFSYRGDMLLGGSIVSPSNSPTKLETVYDYDSYGNKIQTSVTGYSTNTGTNQTRISTVEYGSRGRFIKHEENGLGEKNTYNYNDSPASSALGVTNKMTLIGPNTITTDTHYDDFQQVERVEYADSKEAETTRVFCSGCVTNSHYQITETLDGAPNKETYFDKWGRVVTSRVKGFDGSWWSTNITYDTQGRQSRVYEPNSTLYTQTIYDEMNRPKEIQNPNGSSVHQYYNGTESRTTDELGRNSYVYSNGFGETASTRDAYYNIVYFTYDAFGNLTKTRTRAHNKDSEITNLYDDWGRKTQMVDPVKGTWIYTYNAFGELYTQKTARLHTTTFNYDVLGRKIRRYEASEGTACWVYGATTNAAQNAIGKLMSKAKYAGVSVTCGSQSTPTPTIKKSYEYDTLGRLDKSTTQIGATSYYQEQDYGIYSRPTITTYTTGTQTVATKTHYNSNGYRYKTTREGDNYLLSEVIEMNSRGQVTKLKNGNQVTTDYGYNTQTGWLDSIDVAKNSQQLHFLDIGHDARGNVKTRRSNYASLTGTGSDFTETYTYDALHRLRTRTISVAAGASALPSAFKTTQTYNFDNWGNFTFKTGAGYYKYDSTKVHKLLGVYTNANFTGSQYSFTYDDNGNVTNDGSRVFTYGSFDKPTLITKGSATSEMEYGVDRELYYKDDNFVENGSSVRYQRFYVGAYEKLIRTGGNGATTEHKYNIGNVVITYDSTGSDAKSFVHTDNQGSVISTTDALGKVTTQDIYDPFGKQSEVYRDTLFITSLPPITDRGYTGHKQMNHVDIIHMGGRIYDPILGRFLQADPFIQSPKNSQSYNRFAYVFNNPMTNTDPSGFISLNPFKSIGRALIKGAVKVFGADVVGIAGNIASIFCGPYAAACAGAWNYEYSRAMGVSSTGALKSAFTAAASSYVFQQIGGMKNISSLERVALHAFTGGITAELQGGKFGHGFISAGLTKAININGMLGTSQVTGMSTLRIVTAAVIGGTISNFTGGKFANGAITAAFAQAYNGEQEVAERENSKADYNALEERVIKFADDNPDQEIKLSTQDIDIIAKEMSYVAKGLTKASILSEPYVRQFSEMDTFLYHPELVGRNFAINGEIYKGGEINYIGVGALAGHYGHSKLTTFSMVSYWNQNQFFQGEGVHNLYQIQPGSKWAEFGRKNY